MRARTMGLLLGYAADRVLGDPQRYHPVAGFGRLANLLESRIYADSRARGAVHNAVLVGGAVAAGAVSESLTHERPIARTLVIAAATWTVLGGRSLEREADNVHAVLTAGDLPAARMQVKRLIGRDTDELDASEISRGVIESVAENTADAITGPLMWGAVLGVPGLLGYRAANTLDAMVGHHNARYENYGWASARLDDLATWPAARLVGLLTMAADPRRARAAWTTWRRDASGHPSPNAGVAESAFAGALGIRLGGTNHYYGGRRIEHRAIMGDGRPAQPHDIVGANRIARRVGASAACVAALAALVTLRDSSR
ncbi:cobalamin biosynthesis protein [Nocardioides sp. Kera G14]|uniref:cobalamin biosynthesis protein n=1 Tax=Nocardioides sp. Kera G14 TaxID=2884264 RepID=UPI001D0FA5CF|nr:cobalamin biosynthesis protein [Nocardioides sp. Kera G14]UDY25031.1 cobalamin biosynthesis protein [Nocardioides sp. Kera G14]